MPPIPRLLIVTVALAFTQLAPPCLADVIVFNNGRTREGKVVEQNDETVKLKDPVTGGETSYRRSDIKEIMTSGSPGGAGTPDSLVRQSVVARDAGRMQEAFQVLLDGAKATPEAAGQLANPFLELYYRQLGTAQKARAIDPAGARREYILLLQVLQNPSARQLTPIPGTLEKMTSAVAGDLADLSFKSADQILAAGGTDAAQRALPLVREAAQLNPGNPTYRFRLGQLAQQGRDYRTALDHFRTVSDSPSASAELRQQAAAAIQEVLKLGGPSLVTPAPTRVAVAAATATPAPPPTQVQAPPVPTPGTQAVALSGDTEPTLIDLIKANKWPQVLAKVQSLFQEAIDSGYVAPAVIVLLALFAFYAIPGWFLRFRSRRGDVLAAEHRLMAARIGMIALIPYVIKAIRSGPPKNRCPFCNKGIDNIESYSDLNFYTCPHCRENITPIYDLRDYVNHLIESLEAEVRRSKSGSSDLPVEKDAMLKLVRAVITLGVRRRASDLHLDTENDGSKIRARIDGLMYELLALPKLITNAFISALKIMATLDITERRIPQDGKATMWIDKNDIDLRINTSPAALGEKVSIRILNQKQITVDPTKLGMEGENLEKFERAIHKPHGLIIVTGPSGSGKSTTLYVALNEINTGDKNIITLEDPVEYQLKGISQMQVNPAANFTFATGLRSILRQDPDVIMVGEIRDKETAVIAVESAMTGHLVFTTLHTIDAPTAFSRLADLDVETRRLAESVICVLGQRLVRTVCADCKKPYKPKKPDLDLLGIGPERGEITYVHGGGCDSCMNTGYMGRLGLFEFLVPDEAMRDILETNASVSVIRELARKGGYRTIREEGILKVINGITTVEEVIRVTS